MKHSAKNEPLSQVLLKPVPILQRNNSMQVSQPHVELASRSSINSSSGLSAVGGTTYRQAFVRNQRMLPSQRQNYQREETNAADAAFNSQLQSLQTVLDAQQQVEGVNPADNLIQFLVKLQQQA